MRIIWVLKIQSDLRKDSTAYSRFIVTVKGPATRLSKRTDAGPLLAHTKLKLSTSLRYRILYVHGISCLSLAKQAVSLMRFSGSPRLSYCIQQARILQENCNLRCTRRRWLSQARTEFYAPVIQTAYVVGISQLAHCRMENISKQ